ncbi:Peptidase S59 domain-containing protein [Lachancea thermotolerans]
MFGSTGTAFGNSGSTPFGSAATPATTGASPFGSAAPNPTPAFGAAQPSNAASGFGGFGATNSNSSAGGTGLFGMSNNSNSSSSTTGAAAPFGQATSAPANGPSLFGSAVPTGAPNTSVPGAAQGPGTAIKPFSTYTEKDATTGSNNVFQSISCMPEYRAYSFEELRYQDYQANRRFPTGPVGSAGVASPFGAQTSSPFAQNNSTNTNAFGMVGNNNNNNNNNNTTGGLFGQNNTGAAGTSAFGQPAGGSLFGANNAANNSPFGLNKPASSGGLFGQPSNTAAPGGSGLFGQSNNTAQGSGGLFGQNNNTGTTGSSMFGATNNAPGQQPGGLFGQPSTNTGGGLFGQNNNANANNPPFGQSNTNTGGGLFGQNPNNGAANSPFGQNNQAQAGGGLFGNKSGPSGGLFGQNNNTSGGGLFGQANNTNNSPFGQNNNAGGGLFGQNNSGNTGGGLFGQNNNNNNTTGGGLFGQNNNNNNNNNNNAGGGLFGQNNNNATGGGLFGQNTANNSTFGQNSGSAPFGQSQQQGSSLFGNKPAGSGGLFGQNNTASTGFGQNNSSAGGGLFGQNNNNNSTGNTGGLFGQNNTNTGSGLFGQNSSQQQQQQQPAGGLFGQNTQQNQGGLFGQNNANTGGGLFGQNNQQQQQQPSGGLFGAKPATGATGGGLFGQNNNQQPPATGGLFGQNNNANQPSTSGGLFGNKPAGSTGGGLFGQNNTAGNTGTTGGGLFGQNNSTAANNSSGGGLFGAKPATNTGGGLFGNKPAGAPTTGGGLFGSKPAGTATGTTGGGLFGAKPAGAATGGLFGNTNGTNNTNATGTQPGVSGGLFGNQQNQHQAAPGSQPSLQQTGANPYGTNELFSRVLIPDSITQPTKPSATKLNADFKKKASLSGAYRLAPKPLFAPRSASTSPVARLGSTTTPQSNGRVLSVASSTDSLGREIVPANTGSSSIFTNESDELILSSNDTLFNPDKKSFKNLIINRKKMEDTVDSKEDDQVLRITFKADGDSTSNEGVQGGAKTESTKIETPLYDDVQGTPLRQGSRIDAPFKNSVSTPLAKTPLKSSNLASSSATSTTINEKPSGVIGDDISFMDDGYYISPSLETLSSMTLLQLRKVSGLTIGRRDYGKIDFLEPVDLSNISLPALCGQLVVFEPKTCTVCPNASMQPAEGEGLNVRARISTSGCYPVDKSTRKPIKDPNHPIIKRHINRLKSISDTKFDSYDPQTGTWVFTVDSPV